MKKKYYRKRDNNFYLDKTKEEILLDIDYNNPETFLLYLEKLDYPYLEYEWNGIINPQIEVEDYEIVGETKYYF